MSPFQTVGVIGKRHDLRVAPTLEALCRELQALGREVLVETESAALLPPHPALPYASRATLAARCDLVVVVGGDGTLLSAARDLAATGVPILGVHHGRLGFMVDVRPEDMRETLSAIFKDDYVREARLLLCAHLHRRDGTVAGPFLAVNDAVIRNQTSIRMLEFETWLDGEFISQHRADGFIVSTPTGSTAYALSGGGPVLHPALEAFSLVPICPHTLSDRPIVVGGHQGVDIVLRGSENTRAMFTCDGQTTESMRPGDRLELRRADVRLNLIHPRNYSYFNILRNKLHWGRNLVAGPDET